MARSFSEAMRRVNSFADGIHPDTKQPVTDNPDIINKTHNFSSSGLENEGLERDPGIRSDKNNNSDRNYKGLRMLIHTDKDFLLAQTWGMEPGLLYSLGRDYGAPFVKRIIQRVNQIGDRYFREGEPIEPQRGRYCRAVIIKEGKVLG